MFKNKKFFIIIITLIIFLSNFTYYPNAYVLNKITDKTIIGGSDDENSAFNSNENELLRANTIPNLISMDFIASGSEIIFKFNNIGDPVDLLNVTVKIGSRTKNFNISNLRIGVTKYTLPFPMLKCHETIEVIAKATDGGVLASSKKHNSSRNIPDNLLNVWGYGSFSSKEACLENHFNKHALSMGITNIISYVNSAISFRINLRGATNSIVSGFTEGVTRWKKNGKYIDIAGDKNTVYIISYGLTR